MRRRASIVAALVVALSMVAACSPRSPNDPEPTLASPSPTAAANVSEHESGPQSPILYGLEVPKGATQVGPLIRYRSDDLIAAYQPQLDAATAEHEAAEQEKLKEQEAETGTPATPTPSESPTPGTRPSDDTFKLLDNPPKPDVTASLMRVDGSPTLVFRRMLVQINAVLPDAKLVTDDISAYCPSRDQRVISCQATAHGLTASQRDIEISVSVDPGNVTTRTSRAGSKRRPVMVVHVSSLGDPLAAQEQSIENAKVPHDVEGEDKSGLIWPRMDVDASLDSKQLDGWDVPGQATLLLSGRRPAVLALATSRVREADAIASAYAERFGTPHKDVVEDLNEISTTYSVVAKDGAVVHSTFVLSGRGSYVMISYRPKEKS